ncbi:MAG TPA: PorV/PorQ family protein, partial [Saprospiraceae bacterium]|nr:PorV/PorQ family protein [Saprospiraceae bacterium]
MKYFSLFALALLLSGHAQAQCLTGDPKDCPNAIITAVPFLRIVPDARSAAMGDAGIAISADANSMHFNASKLAFIDSDHGISASYSPWLRSLGLQDVYLAYLSGFKRLGDDQTLGASLRYFSLGDLQFTDISGMSLGQGKPNEFEISLAYARKLSEYFSAGLTGKFIYSNLAGGQQIDNVDIVPATA